MPIQGYGSFFEEALFLMLQNRTNNPSPVSTNLVCGAAFLTPELRLLFVL